MELLESVFKIDKSLLYYLPLLVKSIEISNIEEMLYILKGILFFIGNFCMNHWNAVQYLKKDLALNKGRLS
jgi:hypothetical protein